MTSLTLAGHKKAVRTPCCERLFLWSDDGRTDALVAEIAFDSAVCAFGVNARFAANEVVGNNGAPCRLFKFNLRLVSLEVATAYHNGPALDLNCRLAFVCAIPFAEFAVAKADRTASFYARYLLARTPERAIIETHGAIVVATDDDFRRVFAAHCDEFAVRN